MKFQLYLTVNNINNKYYIGIHRGNIFDDGYYGSGILLKQAIKKNGKENFSRQIIAEFDDAELAYLSEKIIVGQYVVEDNMSYNLRGGGLGMVNPSKETLIKMSKAQLGKKLSKETRNRISKGLTGRNCSAETRKKISEGNRGKKRPDDVIKRISETKKGQPSPNKGKTFSKDVRYNMSKAHRKPVVQLTKSGEFVRYWSSIKETGFHKVSNVCSGKRKTAGGYRWMYKEEYDKQLTTKNKR